MPRALHFAFPDAVLHYDCARCTALCCRGSGFAAHDRELVQLLPRAPQLSQWATARTGRLVHFQNPAGRCYFLDGRDRCSIEQELGRAQKPSLCKAFPFNRVHALGDTRVVLPHFLCPLTLQPYSHDNQGVHARLAEELEQDGWLDQDFLALVLPPGGRAEVFLDEERALREACGRALAQGAQATGELCELSSPSAGEESALARTAALLGFELASAADVDAWFLALAPTWSIEHSHLSLPVRRRALRLAHGHVRRALELGPTPATLQIVNGLWSVHLPLYELLAQFDLAMPAGLLYDSGDPATMLTAAVIHRLAQRGASVLEALEEGCADLSTVDRQSLLCVLAAGHRKRTLAAAKGGSA